MFAKGFFLAVGNRCAVDFSTLDLPFSDEEALKLLERQGYKRVGVNLTELARSLIGKAVYQKNCQPYQFPDIVDCSGLTKWLYAQKGIWLPRHPIDQRDCGFTSINLSEKLVEGDLIFSTGSKTLYWDNPENGVGHVVMVSSKETVIHAANARLNLVEQPLQSILQKWEIRGIVRIIKNPQRTFTLICPEEKPVECSVAFRWKVFAAQQNRQ